MTKTWPEVGHNIRYTHAKARHTTWFCHAKRRSRTKHLRQTIVYACGSVRARGLFFMIAAWRSHLMLLCTGTKLECHQMSIFLACVLQATFQVSGSMVYLLCLCTSWGIKITQCFFSEFLSQDSKWQIHNLGIPFWSNHSFDRQVCSVDHFHHVGRTFSWNGCFVGVIEIFSVFQVTKLKGGFSGFCMLSMNNCCGRKKQLGCNGNWLQWNYFVTFQVGEVQHPHLKVCWKWTFKSAKRAKPTKVCVCACKGVVFHGAHIAELWTLCENFELWAKT